MDKTTPGTWKYQGVAIDGNEKIVWIIKYITRTKSTRFANAPIKGLSGSSCKCNCYYIELIPIKNAGTQVCPQDEACGQFLCTGDETFSYLIHTYDEKEKLSF